MILKQFNWLELTIKGKELAGKGCIDVHGLKYCVKVKYSPLSTMRMDDIKITNHKIKYHDDIHVYGDLALCLYHPIIDKPIFRIISLYNMVPWISEWCHFYEEWKKYGVWLGKEIRHRKI